MIQVIIRKNEPVLKNLEELHLMEDSEDLEHIYKSKLILNPDSNPQLYE